jgi:hypothetical protein
MPARPTSTAINAFDLKKALPQLQVALESFDKGVRIYRGLSHTESKYRHKPQMQFGQRVSANTDNYYTLIVDHDPAWSDYPPRSASIICTNIMNVAGGYGTPYVVLPIGDPQMGICSAVDYWQSFARVKKIGGGGHTDLSDLNLIIRRMVHQWVHISNYKPTDYNHLTQVLDTVDEEIAAKNINWQDYLHSSTDWKMQEQAQLMLRTPSGSLLEKLQWLLNPDANNFRHAHLSAISELPGHHELWMHAGIYMINTHLLPNNWWSDSQFSLRTWIEQL